LKKEKVHVNKDALLGKTADQLIDELKGRWSNYDKWVNFPWGWWKPEDKVHWPRFDGKGEAKAPFLRFSGRHDVPPPKPETQTKLINNTYYRTLYL
jgi:hypothetical protein